jgi:phospholipase A1
LSRSWNRAILNIGLERENWVIMLRPWYRIPETKSNDDNPDISNYIGRGDLQITRKWNNNEFSLMLRHSLKGGENSHGAAQLDWSFPIKNNIRGFAQVFDGYGESLIDYNHHSTYFGLGISLLNWY